MWALLCTYYLTHTPPTPLQLYYNVWRRKTSICKPKVIVISSRRQEWRIVLGKGNLLHNVSCGYILLCYMGLWAYVWVKFNSQLLFHISLHLSPPFFFFLPLALNISELMNNLESDDLEGMENDVHVILYVYYLP